MVLRLWGSGCLGGIGAILLVLVAASVPLLHVLVKQQVKKKVILEEGSMLYSIWKKPTQSVPVYLQFYVFDLTNPIEVSQGEKPFMKQKGPYSYREYREKYDIIHNPNGTVTYRERISYHFAPEMSVGDETDSITCINMVLLAFVNAIRTAPPVLQNIASILLTMSEEELFEKRSIYDLIWGYDDQLLVLGNKFFPEWFYTTEVGALAGRNNTDYGVMTIHTGRNDISKLGIIDRYNGTQYLHYWTTPFANKINGTDGSLVHPFVTKSDRLYVFAPDICRSVYGTYNSSSTWPNGVPLMEFLAADAVLVSSEINPDNIGFCTPQSHCLGSGVLNITQCKIVDHFHIPLMLSLPHFLKADAKYRDAVYNMHPDPQEHTTITLVEPTSGILFHVAKKLQINIFLQLDPHIQALENVPSVVYPILWMNESVTIDDSHAEMIHKELVVPLRIAGIVQYLVLGLGLSLMAIAAGFALASMMRPKKTAVIVNPESERLLPEAEGAPVPNPIQ